MSLHDDKTDIEKQSNEHVDHTGPLKHARTDAETREIAHQITDVEHRAPDSFQPLPKGLQAKIDYRLVPILAFMYGMSLIDRTDLPTARLAGMDASLGFQLGQRYTIAVSVFFVTYVLIEIPANWIWRRLRIAPKLWLPTWALCFGLVKLGSGWSPTWEVVAGCRVLLGVFEGALFPGCVYLISCWYPRYETGKRISAFYLGGALLGGFGNIIGYGWSQIPNDGILPWQWVFVMMGVLTIASAFLGYIIVPNFPQAHTSGFLTDEERKLVLRRIEIDRHDIIIEVLTLKEVFHHILNIRIWAYALLFCLSTLPAYAFAYFLSLILRGSLGYSIKDAQIYSAFPYITAAAFGGIMSFISDRLHHRGGFVILGALISLVGTVVLGYTTDGKLRYGFAFLALMGCQSNIAMIVSWSSNNIRTQNGRAVNSAAVVAGGGIGGIIAGVAFYSASAPQYIPGLLTVIVAQCVIIVVSATLMVYYKIVNGKADRGERVLEGHATYRYTL